MPPKVKITREEIINTAIELVRANGETALNARAISTALNCSTQPVFSNFATMNDLNKTVIHSVYELYLDFINKEVQSGKYPQYKAYGMAYIRFATEEKELFRLLFMRDRTNEDISPSIDFERSVELIMEANGVSKEEAMLMHLEMWTCVHGIGVMIVTSFLSFDQELISKMISDIYQGVRSRHLLEDNKNECN